MLEMIAFEFGRPTLLLLLLVTTGIAVVGCSTSTTRAFFAVEGAVGSVIGDFFDDWRIGGSLFLRFLLLLTLPSSNTPPSNLRMRRMKLLIDVALVGLPSFFSLSQGPLCGMKDEMAFL